MRYYNLKIKKREKTKIKKNEAFWISKFINKNYWKLLNIRIIEAKVYLKKIYECWIFTCSYTYPFCNENGRYYYNTLKNIILYKNIILLYNYYTKKNGNNIWKLTNEKWHFYFLRIQMRYIKIDYRRMINELEIYIMIANLY